MKNLDFNKSLIFGFIIIQTFYFYIASAGRIKAFGSKFISISNSNPDQIADYNFTMILETPLPSTGLIQITFPKNQYPTGLAPG